LAGATRLGALDVAEQQLPGVARTVAAHPLIANTPQPPGEQELLELLQGAL
jgi:alcohol dehydrogenase class IV